MSNAYVEFDAISEKPLKVTWTKTSTCVVEISKDLAVAFLEGREKIDEYSIYTDDGVKKLDKKKKVESEHAKFSSLLSTHDNNQYFEIKTVENFVEIKVHEPKNNYILYACLKNDPSWLIQVWDISEKLDHNRTIKIFIKNASNYTYFIRKTI